MTNPNLSRFDWTSSDAVHFREFLSTDSGKKLLTGLALEEPELLDGGDVNKTLVRSGEVRHHKHVIATLLNLTGEGFGDGDEDSKPDPINPDYPPLEDDEFWTGEKLNPAP